VPFFRGYKEAKIEPQVHLLNRNKSAECNGRKQSNFGIEVDSTTDECWPYGKTFKPAWSVYVSGWRTGNIGIQD